MRRDGLKGQQRIAQGNALGRQMVVATPCKGKSSIAGQRPALVLLPLQGVCDFAYLPRALPWAIRYYPFGAFNAEFLPSYFCNITKDTLRMYMTLYSKDELFGE